MPRGRSTKDIIIKRIVPMRATIDELDVIEQFLAAQLHEILNGKPSKADTSPSSVSKN